MSGAIVLHGLSLLLHAAGATCAARLSRGRGGRAWLVVCIGLVLHGIYEVVEFAPNPAEHGLYNVLIPSLALLGLAIPLQRYRERARAFDEQRASERRFRAVFERAFQFAGVLDPDGTLREVNRAALDFVRAAASDVIGLPFWETPWWDHDPALQRQIRDVVNRARNGEFVRVEMPTRSGENRRAAVDFSLKPVHDDDTGEIVMLIAEGRDLTELRRTEAALMSSERHFRALIENASDVMLVLDAGLAVRYASPSAERATGMPRRRLVGRSPIELIHRDDRDAASAALASAARHVGVPAYCTHRVRHIDGSWLVFESAATALPGHDGEEGGFVVNARDVTDRERLERQLRQASKMEAVGSLAAGVAHDFNNLLTAILGYSEIILSQLPPDGPLRHEMVEIRAAGERAAALTRQLLAFSRQQILQPTIVPLNQVVVTVRAMLRRLIGTHIELETTLGANVGSVLADPDQLAQVVVNLAVNARDAMPNGGRLRIETREVEVTERQCARREGLRPGRYVALVVSDDGEGIEAATLRRIFEPFFTTKAVGKGTGLGLATVYGIVKQSGGYIYADSHPGRGATFTVYLPPAGREAKAAASTATSAPRRGRETILLAEDEEAVRDLVATVLGDAGYRVLEAANGEEALAVLAAHDGPLDLLITDVVMPGLVGPELARRAHLTHEGLPLLYITGYAGDFVMDLELHGNDAVLLQKPFTPHELTATVREVLDGRAAPTA